MSTRLRASFWLLLAACACAPPCVDDGFMSMQLDPLCSAVTETSSTTGEMTATTTESTTTTASTTTTGTSTTTETTSTTGTSTTTETTSTTDELTSTTEASTDGSSSTTGGMEPLTVDAGSSVCGTQQSPPMLQALTMGGDGNYMWSWTPTTDLDDPMSQTPTVTPGGGPTTYTVDVLDGMNDMASDSVTVHFTDQTLVLDPNVCTAFDFTGVGDTDPLGMWQWDPNTKTVCQVLNGRAGMIFCEWELDNAAITGTFSVNTGDDDDWIGLVWGIQDTDHFYLFTWKQSAQNFFECGGSVPMGMQVKVIDVKDPMSDPQSCADRHQPADTVNSKLLVPVDQFYEQGWEAFTEYLFELTHKDTGEITIVIRRKDNMQVVAMKTFMDATYLSGKFGVYQKSQLAACFADLTASCIP
ncbi:MAG: hypothetical protein IPK80_16215 [Nannocystis sp.]|nr:hypothetical protein [Nannocystis sp.]